MTTHESAGDSTRAFATFGKLVLAALIVVGLWVMALVVPPWNRVVTEREKTTSHMLPFSESRHLRVIDSDFAGFDFLFSGRKWGIQDSPTVHSSGSRFKRTEYQIAGIVLLVEWVVVLAAVASGWAYLRHASQ